MNTMTTQELQLLMRTVRTLIERMAPNLYDSDDVLQNVMMKLIRANVIVSEQHPGWLYTIVRNCVADFYRRQAKHTRARSKDCYVQGDGIVYLGDDWTALATPAATQCSAEPDVRIAIEDMLDRLPSGQRQVMILTLEGYTYAEIALSTRTSIGTVRSRLHYARKRARQALRHMMVA